MIVEFPKNARDLNAVRTQIEELTAHLSAINDEMEEMIAEFEAYQARYAYKYLTLREKGMELTMRLVQETNLYGALAGREAADEYLNEVADQLIADNQITEQLCIPLKK